MVLTLTVRNEMTIPLEVETLLPERLRDLRAAEIERLPVLFGNQTGSVGEYFHVSGEVVENQEMRFVGACENLKRIGEGMSQGRIVVEGSAGMHLGAEMHGGEILVTGNVSDWCGAELDGGTIRIRGNAADHLGGAYRGAKRGMTGGEILVEGNCGHEAGQGMRRGLIGVAGNVGDSVGYQMSGGTILAGRKLGVHAGAGLKRGTIAWLGEGAMPQLLATYRRSVRTAPVFLKIYLEHLRRVGFPLPQGCLEAEYRRYCGDFLELGRGEILLREAA